MSWTLFAQLFVLILLVYIVINALIEKFFETRTTNRITEKKIIRDEKLFQIF